MSSFPRKRESRKFRKLLDPRFRGDDIFRGSLVEDVGSGWGGYNTRCFERIESFETTVPESSGRSRSSEAGVGI
jgi:hypothetical protein